MSETGSDSASATSNARVDLARSRGLRGRSDRTTMWPTTPAARAGTSPPSSAGWPPPSTTSRFGPRRLKAHQLPIQTTGVRGSDPPSITKQALPPPIRRRPFRRPAANRGRTKRASPVLRHTSSPPRAQGERGRPVHLIEGIAWDRQLAVHASCEPPQQREKCSSMCGLDENVVVRMAQRRVNPSDHRPL
jgi:hypothetical protein